MILWEFLLTFVSQVWLRRFVAPEGAPFRNNHHIVLNFNQKVETAYVNVRTCVIETIPATSAGIFDTKIAGHSARLSGIRLPKEGADGLHGFNKRLCFY